MKHLFLLSSLFLPTSFLSATELYLPPVPETSVRSQIFATAENVMPEKSPAFTLTLHETAMEIAVEVPRAADKPYRQTGKGQDDPMIFTGETIEIMLAPNGKDYYHLGISPEGFLYTARGRDRSWGNRLSAQTQKNSRGWAARIFIPYSLLQTAFPCSGDRWRFNVGTTLPDSNGGLRSLNWNGATNYHDPQEYGELLFEPSSTPILEAWECCGNQLRATLLLPAETKALPYCMAGDRRYTAEPAGKRHCRFSFPLPTKETPTLRSRFQCRFFAGDGTLLREIYAPAANPQQLTLDSFYYLPGTLLHFSHTAPEARIRLRQGQKPLAEQNPAPAQGTISLEGLTPGDYIVELLTQEETLQQLIRVVPANFAPPAISPDAVLSISQGLLQLDGIPHFLIGASEFPKFPLSPYAAFNLSKGHPGIQENAVCFTPQPGIRRMISYPDASRILPDLLPEIRKSYQAHPDHRRSFARLSYEAQMPLNLKTPEGKRMQIPSQPVFAALYTALKQEFPQRLYSIHIDNLNLIPSFGPYCDILELTSWRVSFSANMLRFLQEDMHQAKAECRKPLLFWLGGSLPSPDLRNAETIRAAVYLAALERLSGIIFHMGHGGIPASRSRLWSLISGINAEIQPVYPDLAMGKELPDFITQPAAGNFFCAVRQHEDRIRLVVWNRSEYTQKLKLATKQGLLEDLFTPLEVKVYTF